MAAKKNKANTRSTIIKRNNEMLVVHNLTGNYTSLTDRSLKREFDKAYRSQNNIRGPFWSPVADMRHFEAFLRGFTLEINPWPPFPIYLPQNLAEGLNISTIRHYDRLIEYYRRYNIIR